MLFASTKKEIINYVDNDTDNDEAENECGTDACKENFVEKVVSTVDNFFGIGSFMGTGLAWTITDCILGFKSQALQGLFITSLSLLWYAVVIIIEKRKKEEVQRLRATGRNDQVVIIAVC